MVKLAHEVIGEVLEELDIKAPTLAKNIGLKYQRISDIQRKVTKNISGEVANAIKTKYPQFNISWLLTGEGDMFVEMMNKVKIDDVVGNIFDDFDRNQKIKKTYPLISIDDIADYGNGDDGKSYENCDQYMVPDFEDKGLEFLIRVGGSSMYPHYSNGDVLGCKKIRDLLFFQWGKVYIIECSQGLLVERIFEDKDNPDNIVCISENKEEYPPFSIPKSDIHSISLVIGAIKME